MKIITLGHVRSRCDCGTEVELESAADIKVGSFGANYGGDTPERKVYYVCPGCGAYVHPKVSAAWRREAERPAASPGKRAEEG